MYNLTVAVAHTYFVGVGQWAVHNTCTVGKNNVDFRRSVNNLEAKAPTVRVGRWMSELEYQNMVTTGQVQVGSEGQATYALLDGPEKFPQHKPNTIYVEFDIPSKFSLVDYK